MSEMCSSGKIKKTMQLILISRPNILGRFNPSALQTFYLELYSVHIMEQHVMCVDGVCVLNHV